jgi:flagellar hook assembly protein FlgD
MRFSILGLVILLAVGSTETAAQIGPPPMWELRQNDPDPFCPGATSIVMELPMSARVQLVVLSEDAMQILRTLVDADLQAGVHSVIWNGRDAGGTVLEDGVYPYRMTATDAQMNILFQATRSATLVCLVGVEPSPWSRLKRLYR